ncbi:MAG TPA: ADP-ribosylglycohydrolase family protein [Thermoanaerobaculia bacterium]|nr:ADP-ribosylglycohydrolase family protein [Thermoanaerobaculia bacterium]
MLGAIIGDIVGSVHEGRGTKSKDFPLLVPQSTFTDDSVLTVAVADWLLTGRDLVDLLHDYYGAHPRRGYGGMFQEWAGSRRREPYNSFGNGSAMRVSPVGFAFDSIEEVLEWAGRSAAVTHDHPEGIRGAQAIAAAVFYARTIRDRDEIAALLESRFGYDLRTPLDDIRPSYRFDVTCQGSVPQAIRAFLESTGYEDAIRNAISLGGDADTLACMAGGIAEAYYGVPEEIAEEGLARLTPDLTEVARRFRCRAGTAGP